MSQPSRPKALGLWLATALVVGNMIGSGVFLLPSSLAQFGGISLLGWLFTAAGAVLLAIVFARLGRTYPRTGGPYEYSRRAFGDFIGFQTAWGYWIAVWAGNAAIAVAFAGYLGVFFPAISDEPWLAAVTALGAIWVLTWVNAVGVRQSGIVQGITTVLKVLPLIVMATIGLAFVNMDHFTPFNQSEGSAFGAITAVAALTLWAFLGLESATIPAEDVENPTRNIPRATIWGTIGTAAIYILSTIAVLGIIPAATLAESTAPFADAAEVAFGGLAGNLVALGAVISTFGALNGWILIQGQIPMAAARDHLFPAAFGKLGRGGTPVFGLVISSVLVTILMATNYTRGLVDLFTYTLLLATLTTLIPYAYSAAAQVMLFVKDRHRFDGKKLTGDVIIAALAFAYSVWAVFGAGQEVAFYGLLLLLAGIPVFVWMKWTRAHAPTRVRVPESVAELMDTMRQ
ncbi:MAG: amino acid permease [Acidimicrobiia bacterium]|nr:amino acid permease [Acidimicrobiia bacterium]MDH4307157.1 amino acid permease [Acidimicrobiia bacterium]MDH5292301.1 amino acid permease [Acidimicrobiia bacterium]